MCVWRGLILFIGDSEMPHEDPSDKCARTSKLKRHEAGLMQERPRNATTGAGGGRQDVKTTILFKTRSKQLAQG